MSKQIWFHEPTASGDSPAGITVSKHKELPSGDFKITEYIWDISLWFVDADNFTDDERQAAYIEFHAAAGVVIKDEREKR